MVPELPPGYYRRVRFFNGLTSWEFKHSNNPNYLIATFHYIYEKKLGWIGKLLGRLELAPDVRNAQFIGNAKEWHTYPSFHSCHPDVNGWIYDKWCKWHYEKLTDK